MDTLILKECRFDCYIGIYPQERRTKQPIIIDVEMAVDIRKAAQSDEMKDALDYRDVHAAMKKHIQNTEYKLIETLIENLAALILKDFPVESVTLLLRKPKPMQRRNGAWAGLQITRSR
ncbi:MAG: dihydroneopterin aldolase [Patescibacteria group bacterium]